MVITTFSLKKENYRLIFYIFKFWFQLPKKLWPCSLPLPLCLPTTQPHMDTLTGHPTENDDDHSDVYLTVIMVTIACDNTFLVFDYCYKGILLICGVYTSINNIII